MRAIIRSTSLVFTLLFNYILLLIYLVSLSKDSQKCFISHSGVSSAWNQHGSSFLTNHERKKTSDGKQSIGRGISLMLVEVTKKTVSDCHCAKYRKCVSPEIAFSFSFLFSSFVCNEKILKSMYLA